MERKLYSRKSLKVSLTVIACVGFVLAVAAAIYIALPSIRARRLFERQDSIQIGKSTFSDVQLIPSQIQTEPIHSCSPAECEWLFGVANFAVPDWWRGWGVAFTVRIHVKDGQVDRKDITYWIGEGSTISAVSVTEKQDWPVNPKDLRSVKTEGTQGQHLIVYIRMTPSDPADVRKQYTSFNWNCLWKYQGCKDEHELMPTGDW